MSEKLLTVGKLVNTHGIRGEVKILSQTDFPELRFAPNSQLILISPDNSKQLDIQIVTAREHKNTYIAQLKGFNDINQVESYKGWLVKVSEKYLAELSEDEYYYHEIIGCRVVTEEGEELGEITEILTPGANDVWVVQRPDNKQVLIPVIDDVLLQVDVPNKTVRIHLMEGLL